MSIDVISPPAPDTRKTLDDELADDSLDGYLWITPAAPVPDDAPPSTFTPRSAATSPPSDTLASALRTVLMREQLAHSGVVATDADAMLQPVDIDTQQPQKTTPSPPRSASTSSSSSCTSSSCSTA